MKVFTCNDFMGHWPVGSASVIIAENKTEARKMLKKKLKSMSLDLRKEDTINEIDINKKDTIILVDGDY